MVAAPHPPCEPGRPLAVHPGAGLVKPFAGDYADVKNFKRKAKDALQKVQAVCPGLVIEDADFGFLLKPGRTAVQLLRKKC